MSSYRSLVLRGGSKFRFRSCQYVEDMLTRYLEEEKTEEKKVLHIMATLVFGS